MNPELPGLAAKNTTRHEVTPDDLIRMVEKDPETLGLACAKFFICEVSHGELNTMVEENPNRYRVGATINIKPRIWNYKSEYDGTTVYHAPVEDTKAAEDELLSMLPDDHPHNTHKKSNHSGGPGDVYAIDTESNKTQKEG